MAGYATKLNALLASLEAACEAVTTANGYDVEIASVSTDLWENPLDRSVKEFPRAYVLPVLDAEGDISIVDANHYDARQQVMVEVWFQLQSGASVVNYGKYAAAVMHAVNAQLASTSCAQNVEPPAISFHVSEKKKGVVLLKYQATMAFSRTDR